MSNIYNLEPPTKGKVILHTNLGDLEIELWAKEAPKACRNFVQLAMEGYYDGTIFHRVIKDYIAQAGDPTGSGTGGESIYGEPFRDEFHQRLKFTRRGLVACANQNEPNTNGSQFFITLDKADWLNNRNTIFGRVVGDTVYNMLRFNDLPVDDSDRPLEPPVIREAEVVWNPFDDMVPRVDREAIKADKEAARMAEERKKRASGRTKNLSLLSFGEEAEADEEEAEVAARAAAARRRIRSAHDVLEDERLAKERAIEEEELARIEAERPAKRPKQSAAAAAGEANALARAKAAVSQAAGRARVTAVAAAAEDEEAGARDEEEEGAAATKVASAAFAASMRAKMAAARTQAGDEARPKAAREPAREPSLEAANAGRMGGASAGADEEEDEVEDETRRGSGRGAGSSGGARDYAAERRAEMEAMKDAAVNKSYGRVNAKPEVADADLLKPWQLQRETYKARKRAVGNREKDTLARLSKFTAALRSAPTADTKREASEPPRSGSEEPAAAKDAANQAGGDKGYAGKVRGDLDHRAYMPAAWRVDAYLDEEEADEEEAGSGLAGLRSHRFEAAKERKDNMARDMDNLDDYVVYDPLLEKGKGKWSAANQKEKKRANEWAGRANM
ncbi:hypothetical protein CHLRE_04g215950v5 [Chlamydomonas reinhardtii]|uniref:Uncharacterized protein n=1 Tax=Chlamydomonas reinhardtii TaxID=3055 RepID=A8J9P9_CHLRE|nr:uncharacterized protein CHLRE_04g215950v5 [Chlamydomonas reinhardtii]PNW83908.1 hypothetical protein CHLRE_04g215950v5 [Chlamydomonas reinhardtii]|eukprot:XP_001698654.1 peptidyl-prolyl cis-trans isomerase, cyclophilin-type [Chlamydomonas reinhardtii]